MLCLLLGMLAACGGSGTAQTSQTMSYKVEMALDAARYGNRSATITISDANGKPVDAEVSVFPTMRSMGMASPEVKADRVGAGRYQTPSEIAFTMTGDWELDVHINAGGNEEIAAFIVPIAK